MKRQDTLIIKFDETDARSFADKLSELINKAPTAVRMIVTPQMAKAMMQRNESDEWRNRPKSERNLRRMTRSIKEGRWAYTGQPIIFSETGRLLNGQHTLTSCINADTSIDVLVVFDVPDESFKYMDIGVKRGAAQILSIENIANSTFIAAASRILMIYMRNPRWAGDLANYDIEPDEILEFYESHADLQESRAAAMRFYKTKLFPPSWAGALHYICAQKDRAAADEFFYRVATGIGLTGESDP